MGIIIINSWPKVGFNYIIIYKKLVFNIYN